MTPRVKPPHTLVSVLHWLWYCRATALSALANLTLLLGKNTLPFPAFGNLNFVSPPHRRAYMYSEIMPKLKISPSTRFFPHKERYEIFDGKIFARKCCRFCSHKNLPYKHKIKCGRMSASSMKWRYLDHLQPLSNAKHSLTTMSKKEVCPRDEIADLPGTAVLLFDIHGFAEGLVSFRALCGMQSSLVRFAPNRAIAWGPPQPQTSLEILCLSPAFS